MQERMSASGTRATALCVGWQCQADIEKCESGHSLARAISAHSQGGIHDQSNAAQQKRAMDVMWSAQRGGSGARRENETGGALPRRGERGLPFRPRCTGTPYAGLSAKEAEYPARVGWGLRPAGDRPFRLCCRRAAARRTARALRTESASCSIRAGRRFPGTRFPRVSVRNGPCCR